MNYKRYNPCCECHECSPKPKPRPSDASIAAYGGRFDNTDTMISAEADTQYQIALPSVMLAQNISYTSPNSVTLTEGGKYELNVFSKTMLDTGSVLVFAVRRNGVNLPETISYHDVPDSQQKLYSISVIVQLDTNDVLDLAVASRYKTTLIWTGGINSGLSVKKLSD